MISQIAYANYLIPGVVGYVCQVLVLVLLFLSVPISSVILASSI